MDLIKSQSSIESYVEWLDNIVESKIMKVGCEVTLLKYQKQAKRSIGS